MNSRSGNYVPVAGKGYKAFEPIKLQDVKIEIDSEMASRLGEANRLLGKLDAMSQNIPNIDLFIGAYVRKEALMSSQIEGTQASLIDVLDPNIEDNINGDVLEVVNYTKALYHAINRLNELPLCGSLLKETHAILLSGSRGEERCPGEFRRSQNWIGGANSTINTAKYVPPTPEYMLDAMADLEKYMNTEVDEIDPLIKAALIHYQFESIHPFLDGNGRIGRMLIVLYLMEKKVIKYPVFYISYFLKQNRLEYYDRLGDVRKKGDYEQWIKFFLDATTHTCEDSINTLEQINILDSRNLELIANCGKSIKAVYSYITKNPIIDINKTAAELNLAFSTVSLAIKNLCKLGILKESTSFKRNRIFNYEDYLNILRKDTENL